MFCDAVVEGSSDSETRARGIGHLLRQHYPELEDRFVREYVGDCGTRDCSHHFEPAGAGEDHPGFTCPHCGEDQSEWYAGMVVADTL